MIISPSIDEILEKVTTDLCVGKFKELFVRDELRLQDTERRTARIIRTGGGATGYVESGSIPWSQGFPCIQRSDWSSGYVSLHEMNKCLGENREYTDFLASVNNDDLFLRETTLAPRDDTKENVRYIKVI